MGTSISEEQEKLIVEAVGGNGRIVLMFDKDGVGKSGSQDALTRLVSQIYVKQIRLGKEELQPDSFPKEKLKEFLR